MVSSAVEDLVAFPLSQWGEGLNILLWGGLLFDLQADFLLPCVCDH